MANQGMKPSIYLETTIVSYLTARPTRDLILTAKMQSTHEWWENERQKYDLFISLPVISEASAGDADAARRRLEVLADLPKLKVTEDAHLLADRFYQEIPLPPQAELDALHLALCTVHAVDFLLTWNCRHLANATLRHAIESISHDAGYLPPIICTPEELMEPSP